MTKSRELTGTQVRKPGNVIFLHDSETRAGHGGGYQAPEKASGQAGLVDLSNDLGAKDLDQTVRGLENVGTLANGDVLRLLPGELSQQADEALERTLGAITREGTLRE